jgi:hypothetical protein
MLRSTGTRPGRRTGAPSIPERPSRVAVGRSFRRSDLSDEGTGRLARRLPKRRGAAHFPLEVPPHARHRRLREPAAERRAPALHPSPGRILTISGPDTDAVLIALNGAQRKLRDPECQKALSDFRDGKGRLLAENLAWMKMTPADYITVLYMRDGSEKAASRLCRTSGVAAASNPGSRHAFVCGRWFRRQPRRARENTLIHEMRSASRRIPRPRTRLAHGSPAAAGSSVPDCPLAEWSTRSPRPASGRCLPPTYRR